MAVSQVRPVADFAIAYAHEVGQAVSRHIGQINGLGAIGEDQSRALLFIDGLAHILGGAEPGFGQRRVPGKGLVFGNQDVRMAITGEVDEFEIGVAPRDIG